MFLPRIQRALDLYTNAWNNHPISGEKNHSPIQLFTVGVQKLLLNGKIAEDFFDNVAFDYGIDYDGGSSNDTSDSDSVAEVIPPMLDLSSPILCTKPSC